MEQNLLGVKINYVRIDQALEIVSGWLQKRGKHYIVTPNPEMLIDAGFDEEFRTALNAADLSVPDSSRLGWGTFLKSQKSLFLRLIYSPFFIAPHKLPRFFFPTTSGIDLMETLLSLSEEKAFTTAYLGGSKKVADKLLKCLRLKYPKLKIVFCAGNMPVNKDGDILFDTERDKMTGSKSINNKSEANSLNQGLVKVTSRSRLLDPRKGLEASLKLLQDDMFNHHLLTEKIDIMFVAFGHGKQEKWIYKNLPKLNTRVMMGVGGAFDYLSGEVPRAPEMIRQMGMEWLFRLMNQPWRIKRFWKLFYFIYLVLRK